jgi:N-acetylglucosaminyl-diphospho-decaprenol L-rhamnosyltransferase
MYSVLKATKNIEAEIIVADNNSIDASLEMLASVYAGRVKVIANDENYGFSKGNNIAVAQAQGTYLCILNPDTIVGEKVFEECLAFAKAEPKAGFIGAQLIDGTGAYLPESKRHIPTPKVARQKIWGNNKNYYYHEVDQNQRGKVDVLVGAFMFCDKKVYDDCGGFDERYFMYGEDIDLSYTALQKGYENYYLGDQKVIHFKGESTVKDKVYLQRFYGAMGLFYDKYFRQSALEKNAIDLLIKGMIALHKNIESSNRNDFSEIVVVTDDPTYQVDKRRCRTFDQLKSTEVIGVQIWWDLRSLELTAIMKYMSENPKHSYRFIAQKRDFYIGSDSNSSRGEVKHMQ